MSKQTGLLNFFKPASAQSSNLKKPILKVGMQVRHTASMKVGTVSKLARNAKGLVEVSVTLETGSIVIGSPTAGKDFSPVDETIRAATSSASPSGQIAPTSQPRAVDAMTQAAIEIADDEIDLDEIQRLEDEALKQRGLHCSSSPASGVAPFNVSAPLLLERGVHYVSSVKPSGCNPPLSGTSQDGECLLTPPTNKKSSPASPIVLAKTQAVPGPSALTALTGYRLANAPQNLAPKPQNAQTPTHTHVQPKGPWWWLEERYVRDSEKRPRDHEDYDPSTVYIPPEIWRAMTDFQQQYWEIKKKNFDMLLLAKLGKFYELYEHDAEVAHKHLGLTYTHGGRDPNSRKMLCAGVPETSVDGIVSKLVALGYKVGIVEEMERASDMKKVNDMRKANAAESGERGGRKATQKVVMRALRRIVTPGTMRDEELLGGFESKPLVSIVPHGAASADVEALADLLLGVCLVDCSTGRFNVGTVALHQIDVLLRTHRPHEVLYPRGRVTGALRTWLRNSTSVAVWSALPPGSRDEEFWPGHVACSRLGELLDGNGQAGECDMQEDRGDSRGVASSGDLPRVIAALVKEESEEANLALNALGGALAYLKKLNLDRDLVSLRKFDDLHGLGDDGPECMLLDIQTLNGLDVLEPKDSEGKGFTKGAACLWHHLDRAVTPFGRRLLRWWVTRPLLKVCDIRSRTCAVEDLLRLGGPGSPLAEVEAQMKRLPDLERKIARIHASAALCAGEQGVAEGAASQKRIARELVAVLSAFRQADLIRQQLHELQPDITAPLLADLIYQFPNVMTHVHELECLFNVELARTSDLIELHDGWDAEYDNAVRRRSAGEDGLQEYLRSQQAKLRMPRLKFAGTGKEPYLLEVPSEFPVREVPAEYHLKAQTKACRRYSTASLESLISSHSEAQVELEALRRRAAAHLCSIFDRHYAVWCRAVKCLAEFDAIYSLAKASESMDGQPMVAAEIIQRSKLKEAEGSAPILSVEKMRHPFLSGAAGGGMFVPTSFELGKRLSHSDLGTATSNCLILTGPNMGGKSTTLRLACFAALLAQLGCYVPAEACKLTPVDRIFTRLGANDDICRGLSTFMVEMKDVEVMLRQATENSLVIIDELGRGTSTFDGHAIAYAVLRDLLERVRCRTLLSTHYHGLVRDFRHDARILPMHMACKVDAETRQLVMLYRLQQGVCPQSYGMECGLRAGLPLHIIERARVKSLEFEAFHKRRVPIEVKGSLPEACASAGVKGQGSDGGKRLRGDRDMPQEARERKEEDDIVRKMQRILEVIPSSSLEIRGKASLQVHRKLAEVWEELC